MRLCLPLIISFLILGCVAKDSNRRSNNTVLELPEKVFDFGTISKNDTIVHQFELKNKGLNPLKIINVNASCDCTIPLWNKDPILPSKNGFIKVKYTPNSLGQISKSIVVQTNTDSTFIVLYLKGFVQERIHLQ